MRKIVLYAIALVLAFSCKKENDELINKYMINGFVQKGPFIQGSEVRIQELNSDLIPNGNSYFLETNDDFGTFESNTEIPEGYIDIATTGFYFNEIEGKLSNSLITLKGISYVNETGILNINILTTLSYDRIKYLISNDNYSFIDARTKAQKEVLKLFYIEIPDSLMLPFEEMDISQSGINNSILLAISSILQFNNTEAELSELVNKISDDIETDGLLNNESITTQIRENSMSLDVASIVENLIKRYSDLGISATIPDFEMYIDSDGDGVININETPNPVFSLPSGVYSTDTIIEITVAKEDAIIYYTIDGSNPDTTSQVYQDPIAIIGDGTYVFVKAISDHSDLDISQIVSAEYSIEYPVITPKFNLSPGEYNYDLEIILTTDIEGSNIYYTTDNTTPDTNSVSYKNPIEIFGDGNNLSIKAIAIKKGFRSEIVSGSYTINYSPALYPEFSSLAGTYNTDIELTMSSQTYNSIIYYTLDGTVPTGNSNIYIAPITIQNDGTKVHVKAIAKSEQTKWSSVAKSYYSINYSYDPQSFNNQLSIYDYQTEVVGTWIGYRTCPWTPPINVRVTFNNDGTYTSESLTPGYVAFYYGSDWEVNSYTIYDLNTDGSATGTIGRFNDSNIDELRYIRFSEELDVISFEFWHRLQYGPLKYVLTRVE